MNFKKRSLFKLLSVSLLSVLLLTGCGGGGGTTSSDSSDINDIGDLVFDDNGNVVFENVEITMWSVTTGDDANTQDEIINEFNELYEGMIHVSVNHTSRYDLETLLTSTMEFDKENAPDVFFSHGSRVNEYVERGWLLPIEPIMEKGGLILDKDDFVESLLSSTTVDGKVYGLPQDVHSAVVVIRKDILEKNNLPMPTNYQELVSVSEQAIELAKKGELWIRGENSFGVSATEWRTHNRNETYYPFPIAFGDMWVHEFVGYTAAIQNGASIIDEDGMPSWNTQGTIDGFQVLKDWMFPTETSTNNEPLSKSYGSDYDVGNEPFRNGSAIFKLLGPWEYMSNLTQFDRELANDGGSSNITTLSLSKFFANDPSKDYASKVKGEGHAFMVMSTVESMTKRVAALVFADYMVNNAGIRWAKRGHLPSLKSVQNSSAFKNDPAYDEYIKYWGTIDDYVVIQPTPYYSYIDSYFKGALQKVMSNTYQNTPIKDIVKEEFEDCLAYIELYS